MMLLGPIPGSRPDWRGANIKGRGKAAAEAVPASLLGATGWEAWTFSQVPKAGFGKRHYHESPLTQTTSKACLPCVDPSTASSGNSTAVNLQLSSCLAAAAAEQRRHRRMIHTPPAKNKPEGKRILPRPASESISLLHDAPAPQQQQPQQPLPLPRRQQSQKQQTSCSSGALQAAASSRCSSKLPESHASAEQQQTHTNSPAAPATPVTPENETPILSAATAAEHNARAAAAASTAAGHLGGGSNPAGGSTLLGSSSRALQQLQYTAQLQAAQALQPAGDLASGRTGVAPRVQDDPNYFRTLKDPPAFQRFCTTLQQQQQQRQQGAASTAARHAAALSMRQRAAEAQARQEVAALHVEEH
uniref:Uncharacterized protein n=1 Tax=Tetradesmus obliquus TaxID=3088 RepID=A0A383WIS8_TETOB|eukprot:jgi/Sobl393_1/14243/SZX77375.1